MEQVKNQDILALIDKIADHYNNNIANRFIRPSFYKLTLERRDWDNVEAVTTKSTAYKYQGFHLDDLYFKVLSLARFVSQARKNIQPHAKTFALGTLGMGKGSPQDRILAEMAGNNFPSNLQVLSDLVNELYIKTTQVDAHLHGTKTPLYQKMPELKEIGSLLVGA